MTNPHPKLALILAVGSLVFSSVGRVVRAGPAMSDEQIERFLLEGKVIEKKEIGSGITRPMKLKLEFDGQTRSAAFKTVDIQTVGLTRFPTAPTELNFNDNYHYERAAYLLDRILGLGMVPPTVLRKIDGTEGAVTDWVTGAINEKERLLKGITPPDPAVLLHQQAVMRLFDALIFNVDRNEGNQLITTADWKLHLIDHTRGFRLWKNLPDEFMNVPASLPRELLDKLAALDAKTLFDKLKGLVSHAQVKTMLKRRDKIVEKIAADREKYGDAMVFQD